MGERLVDASKLCWTFAQKGCCPRGSACKWSHQVLEKDPSDSVCRAWLLWGTCPRKESCAWEHPPVCMRTAPEVQGFGGQPPPPYVYNFAVGFGAWDAGECFWNGSGYMAVAPAEISAVDGKKPEGIVCGAAAGQQLLSLLQADEKISDQLKDKAGRPLKPWEEDSGEGNENEHGLELTYIKQLDVPLEDMDDAGGEWDQFVVNQERFGVKSTFKDDLSQYTTALDVKTVPAEVRKEAERVATEIEEEREALGCLDGDVNSPETACDKEYSEEAKFSAVARRSGSAAVPEAAK